MKPLALIAAIGSNNVIGVRGTIPWRIPEDLRFFKEKTTGHAIIMGRKTWDSIGRPLPNRLNIVVTRHSLMSPDKVRIGASAFGIRVANSLELALAHAREVDEEPFIIGGAEIYRLALPLVTRMFITRVKYEGEGDVIFPFWDHAGWTRRIVRPIEVTDDPEFNISEYTR
jgi:dihydrofolate reductase